jgi:integrase
MASIRQKPGSPYWYACLTLPHARTERSTKIRITGGVSARRKAQALADLWERDLIEHREAQRAHAVVDQLMGQLHGKASKTTVESYLNQWLRARSSELSKATQPVYAKRAREFIAALGAISLSQLSTAQVRTFRETLSERVSPNTVNKYMSTLKTALQDAVRDGQISSNPCDPLRPMKVKKKDIRRPFTLPELRAVVALASPEWRSMILFGLYTGQRLHDIATLTWANLDLINQELRFVSGKGNKRMTLPLHPCLMDLIQETSTPSNPQAPLHPDANRVLEDNGRVSSLSAAFRKILVSAGLATSRNIKPEAPLGDRRAQSELSFHALRHTATSLLKQAGISGPVVQELIGHESAAINQLYTHIDQDTLRRANASLPAL